MTRRALEDILFGLCLVALVCFPALPAFSQDEADGEAAAAPEAEEPPSSETGEAVELGSETEPEAEPEPPPAETEAPAPAGEETSADEPVPPGPDSELTPGEEPLPEEGGESQPPVDEPAEAATTEGGTTLDSYMQKAKGSILQLGFGMVTPGSKTKSLVGSGLEYTIAVLYPFPIMEWPTFIGLEYAFRSFENNLASPSFVDASPVGRMAQNDFIIFLNYNHQFMQDVLGHVEFGPALQHRKLIISSKERSLGDDYAADYAFGYLLRLAVSYQREVAGHPLSLRLYFAMENGQKISSSKLHYNGERVDINEAQTMFGLNLGYQFH